MMRMVLRSRGACRLLAVIGVVYALSALGVLAWFVADLWAASPTLVDRVLQFALLVCAACGVWFVVIGLDNLAGKERSQRRVTNATSVGRA